MNQITPQRPTTNTVQPTTRIETLDQALKNETIQRRIVGGLPAHVTPERMLRTCSLAVYKNPALRKADWQSVIGSFIACSILGLEPNTPLGHAYLIPFEDRQNDRTEVNLIIGYRGLIDLARRTGSLVNIHGDVIYEGDEWSFEYGSNQHLRHVPIGDREGRSALYGYAYAKLSDGEAFEVLPYERVLAIRDGAQSYRAALYAKAKGWQSWKKAPWIAYEHEMASKTMIRRLAKYLPMSIEFQTAVALDSGGEAGRVDFAQLTASPIVDVEALGGVIDAPDGGELPDDTSAQESAPVQDVKTEPAQAASEPATVVLIVDQEERSVSEKKAIAEFLAIARGRKTPDAVYEFIEANADTIMAVDPSRAEDAIEKAGEHAEKLAEPPSEESEQLDDGEGGPLDYEDGDPGPAGEPDEETESGELQGTEMKPVVLPEKNGKLNATAAATALVNAFKVLATDEERARFKVVNKAQIQRAASLGHFPSDRLHKAGIL